MLYSCPKMLFNLAQYPCTVGIFNHRSNINTISSINVINVEYIGNDINIVAVATTLTVNINININYYTSLFYFIWPESEDLDRKRLAIKSFEFENFYGVYINTF